jgi:UDP-N-acetylglucosamine 3-dehydrogenase
MRDKLKVGLVGCGGIASMRHIPSFMSLKNNVVLQAVCDKNESLARDIANKYHIPNSYSDFSLMVSKENLDVVDICTPPQTHASLAIQALEDGCHVILEKPMALKTSDCDEMVQVSHKCGLKLCVIHNQLFYPPFIKARNLVGEGAIGKFTGMRMLTSDPRDEMLMRKNYWIHKLPGGMIGETGPHIIYKALPFIGSVKSVDVSARNSFDHSWTPFDEYRIELDGEHGACSILVTYSSNRRASTVDLLGTEGVLCVDLVSMLLMRHHNLQSMNPLALASHPLRTSLQIIGGIAKNAFQAVRDGRNFFGHQTIINGFVNSVLQDTEPPVTAEEGRETVRVLEMTVDRLREKYRTQG